MSRNIKICVLEITQQFSQSLFQIQTRTRTRRHCWGGCPRRLIKTLQPPSQCPRGVDRPHRVPDTVPTSDWCECGRGTRQGPDQACFSCFSGFHPRWTNYARIPNQNRAGPRPWGSTVKQDTSGTILLMPFLNQKWNSEMKQSVWQKLNKKVITRKRCWHFGQNANRPVRNIKDEINQLVWNKFK